MPRDTTRIRKSLLVLATLTAACLLGAPRDAHATLEIFLAQNGAAPTSVATGGDFTQAVYGFPAPATFGDFTVKATTASSNNLAPGSNLLGANVEINNNSDSAQTLHIWIVQTNYTLPAGTPLSVESGLTFNTVGSSTVGLTNVFQAWFDPNNGGAVPPVGVPTNGPQNATQVTSTLFSTDSRTGSFARTGMYSLISVANITLSAGGTMNFSDHISVTGAPEPATVASALFGLGLVAGLGRLRRRRVVA